MAGKYETGSYSITTFNERGTKLEKTALGHIGLIKAQEHGRSLVADRQAHSFVIERVLHNSMDNAESWLPKATGRFSDGKPYGETE
jgi:hypothetical protein